MVPNQLILCVWILCMVLTMIAIFNMNVFKFLDDSTPVRKNHLGELRFILSSAVLFHHLVLCGFYFDGQNWTDAGHNISAYFGKASVAIFFMISGFLFGVVNKNNFEFWVSFYTKRLFRLGPMCFVSSFLCLLFIFSVGEMAFDFKYTVLKSILWFDAGILNIKPDVNSVKRALLVNAGATWTLRWEWCLYFFLPILSFFSCKNKIILSSVICIFAMTIIFYVCHIKGVYYSERLLVIYSVFFGVLCRNTTVFDKREIMLLLLSIGAAVCDFLVLNKPSLLFPSCVFLMASKGSCFLGFLKKHKGLKRLGNISYSVFHLHGIIWYFIFFSMGGYLKIASVWIFLSIVTVGFFVIVVAATAFYVYVEKKAYVYFIRLQH